MSNIDPGPTGRNTWARRNDSTEAPPEQTFIYITDWSEEWPYDVSSKCLEFLYETDFLTEWETGFVKSVLDPRAKWTPKRIEVINKICRKAMAANFRFEVPKEMIQ